jgi:hypothetical protein
MKCPYLEEVAMRYCKAYPIKKMIPASASQLVSPCFSNPDGCPIHQDVTHRRPIERSCGGQAGKECGQPCPLAALEESPKDNQDYCVWLKQEIVSYRLCTHNYQCESCKFEQMLIEQNDKYQESPQTMQEIERLKNLPAGQRRCKYTVTGKVLYEPCRMSFECWQCPTYKDIRSNIVEHCIAEAKK